MCMATFSHSRISTFETCKLKYKYAYIDKVKKDVKGTIETFMGSRVHETLEKLYKDLNFEKHNTKQDLLDFYEKKWEQEWDDSILVVKEQYSPENYKEMGKRMISDYYEHYKPFNQSRTIGLETEDYYDLDENYKIHIRIDRLSSPEPGVYEIHDYKTNSSLKTQEEADKDRQLAVYSMGVKQLYPDAKKIKLIWHMLAFDREVVSERTEDQLETLRIEILEEIKKIEQENDFEPKKSALCTYCEYQSMCPLWAHKFKIKDLPEEKLKKEEGYDLVNRYKELKEKEKEIQTRIVEITELIKKYSEQFNMKTLFGETGQITVWTKDVIKFPKKNEEGREQLINVLKALNLYEKYLDINNWDLEKDYDNLNEIEKQILSKIARKEKITKLYSR